MIKSGQLVITKISNKCCWDLFYLRTAECHLRLRVRFTSTADSAVVPETNYKTSNTRTGLVPLWRDEMRSDPASFSKGHKLI